MSLVEMAIAFVIRHPAVTAAIVGPRTMDQVQVPAALRPMPCWGGTTSWIGSTRSCRPGVNLNPADAGWPNPALEPAARRRD